MKTKISSLTLFVAALGCFLAASLRAAPPSARATAYPVNQVTRDGAAIVKVGSAEAEVTHWLGTPAHALGNGVIVYHRFHGSVAGSEDCSLMLTIAGGRVAQILLVNDQALTTVAAAMKVDPAAGQRVFVAGK